MKSNLLRLTLVLGLFCLHQGFCFANNRSAVEERVGTTEERTIEEFKEYIAKKFTHVSDAQLQAIGELADVDGDGMISDEEFEDRMTAVLAVLAGSKKTDEGEEQEAENGESHDDEEQDSEQDSEQEDSEQEDAEGEKAGKADPKSDLPKFELPRAEVLIVTSSELAESWQDLSLIHI